MNALSQRFEYILIYLTDNRFHPITTVLSAVMCVWKMHIYREGISTYLEESKEENPSFPLIVPSFNNLILINACHIFYSNLSFSLASIH